MNIHDHIVYDMDKHFVIDPITREITNAESKKNTLQQYDHNSEIFTFEINRDVEGHDMTLCNRVEIHYINTSAASRATSFSSVYEVQDLQIDPADESKVIFSWLVSNSATQYAGGLNFLISFACTEGDAVTYRWNTGINKNISIASGMNNGEDVIEGYDDILNQWYDKLFGIGETEEARILELSEEQQAVIKKLSKDEQKAISDSVPDDYETIAKTVEQLEKDSNELTVKASVDIVIKGKNNSFNEWCVSCSKGAELSIRGDIYDISLACTPSVPSGNYALPTYTYAGTTYYYLQTEALDGFVEEDDGKNLGEIFSKYEIRGEDYDYSVDMDNMVDYIIVDYDQDIRKAYLRFLCVDEYYLRNYLNNVELTIICTVDKTNPDESQYYFATKVECECGDIFKITGLFHPDNVQLAFVDETNVVIDFMPGQFYVDETIDYDVIAPLNSVTLWIFTIVNPPMIKKAIKPEIGTTVESLDRGYTYSDGTIMNNLLVYGTLTSEGERIISEDPLGVVTYELLPIKKHTKIVFSDTVMDDESISKTIIYQYDQNGDEIGLLAEFTGPKEYTFADDCYVHIGSSNINSTMTIYTPEPVEWQREVDGLKEVVEGLASGEAYGELQAQVDKIAEDVDDLKGGEALKDLENKINELDKELDGLVTGEDYEKLTELKDYLDENEDAINTLQTAIQNSNGGLIVSDVEPENYPYFWFNTTPGQTKVATLKLSTDGNSTVTTNIEGVTYSVDNATSNEELTSENQYDFTII